jgi:hypothetical protein
LIRQIINRVNNIMFSNKVKIKVSPREEYKVILIKTNKITK